MWREVELQSTQSKHVNAVCQLLHQLLGRLVLRSHVHQQSLHTTVETCEHRAHLLLRRLQVREGGRSTSSQTHLARKACPWSSATCWKSSESTSWFWLGSSGFQAARPVVVRKLEVMEEEANVLPAGRDGLSCSQFLAR